MEVTMVGEYLTTEEYARMKGVPVDTVRTRIRKGQIPVIRAGRSYMIKGDTEWVDNYYSNCGRYKKGSTNNAKRNPS
jgi:excisionase family DNA binding protein